MTAQKHTPDDLLDLIETAISDSMDMDWTPRLGAEHVYRAMEREGVIAQLDALPKAKGYLLNAKIDLETGAPKRTAINTITGGIRMVDAAIAKATGQ